MAESDDLVRQAAERIYNWRYDEAALSNIEDISALLAPFFAAARKEARGGALNEAIDAQCVLCQERVPLVSKDDHQLPSGRLVYCRAIHLRTLRSKPEEPAVVPSWFRGKVDADIVQRVTEAERAREEPTAAFDPDDAD